MDLQTSTVIHATNQSTSLEFPFVGGRGDDTLYRNASRNKLKGRGGDDVLIGGAGNDSLDGGGGLMDQSLCWAYLSQGLTKGYLWSFIVVWLLIAMAIAINFCQLNTYGVLLLTMR
ncbi:hypothetical protein [cf. Phormidesmis sp. LEGE 11477]|uniref:hypothetical protein n=1 Tax=cf. Phormidesmis sp. LEGE 11477 TaxID=1828680 RepID=UPI001881A196|nr:hypothetical protein [cf. Phormidesmis sp. LEGE 11477]MBE9064477.1 hypothetical protein [cf. Phormidesmis sp. LEGE 11477]